MGDFMKSMANAEGADKLGDMDNLIAAYNASEDLQYPEEVAATLEEV